MRSLVFAFVGSTLICPAAQAQEFKLEVIRSQIIEMEGKTRDGTAVKGKAVVGDLGLNNMNMGGTVENADTTIPAGTYKGTLRYISDHGHVAGPLGELGNQGDFLIEINVPGRDGILFHGGNKPWHSTGCILLGAVSKEGGTRFLPSDHPLRALRKAFYGTETPIQTPNKPITVIITDNIK